MSLVEEEKQTAEILSRLSSLIGNQIPGPILDKLAKLMAPSRIKSNILDNKEKSEAYCSEMQVGNIVHVCHSDTGDCNDDPWLIMHYRVGERSEDDKKIIVKLERTSTVNEEIKSRVETEFKKMPESTIVLSWNKSSPISELSCSPLDWKFITGINGVETRLWPYLGVSRVCSPTNCEHKGRDGISLFYFGP